jgi:MFS family permease
VTPAARGAPVAPAADAAARPPRERLYTPSFVGVLATNLLAFTQWFSLQPVIPLIVLQLGGDATLAGIAFAVFSVPSITMRPIFGRLIDRVGNKTVLLAGTLGIGLLSPLYLVGSLGVLVALRAFHGIAWAAVMTSVASLMARLAPRSRRGEAAGIFDLMPGTAQMVMPAVGLLVFHATGITGVFLAAAAMGLAAAGVVWASSPPDPPRAELQARHAAAVTAGTAPMGLPLLEPTAVLPMVLQMLFMSGSPLFVVYPPILAQQNGIPLSDLALYYPVYGLLLVGSRFLISRVLDTVSRSLLVGGSAAGAVVALLLATQATSIGPLLVAGALFAVGCGISVPVGTAIVIDRSPAERMGSAMGTYTIGFQLASGLGAAIWGVVIDNAGFGVAYAAGALVQVVLIVVATLFRTGIDRPAHLRRTA